MASTGRFYARHQWVYLRRYVDDGDAPIDNNLIERDIRPFPTGRNTWLFSATVAGAQASADSVPTLRRPLNWSVRLGTMNTGAAQGNGWLLADTGHHFDARFTG